VRPVSRGIIHGRLKSSVAVSRQDADMPPPAIKVDNRQVEPMISVEVSYCDRNGTLPSRNVDRSSERAITVTEQDTHPSIIPNPGIPAIDHSQLNLAAALKARISHRHGFCSHGIVHRWLESDSCTGRRMAECGSQQHNRAQYFPQPEHRSSPFALDIFRESDRAKCLVEIASLPVSSFVMHS